MAKHRWWKHRKSKQETTWVDYGASGSGEYTIAHTGGNWTFGSSPTRTTTRAAEPIFTLGQYAPVDILPPSTILENSIIVPHEAVDAMGGIQEFLEGLYP